MMSRRKVLLMSATVLTIANLAALPNTLAELSGAGKGTMNLVPGSGCGCQASTNHLTPEAIKSFLHAPEDKVTFQPMSDALCYDQSSCVSVVDPVFRCQDVFWPCSWDAWHELQKGYRTATVCKMSNGQWCVMYYNCDNWKKVQCCDEEYNHCRPTNRPCSEIPPCPVVP